MSEYGMWIVRTRAFKGPTALAVVWSERCVFALEEKCLLWNKRRAIEET